MSKHRVTIILDVEADGTTEETAERVRSALVGHLGWGEAKDYGITHDAVVAADVLAQDLR